MATNILFDYDYIVSIISLINHGAVMLKLILVISFDPLSVM